MGSARNPLVVDEGAVERLMNKVTVRRDTGCWEWSGFRQRQGYGVLMVGGISRVAHRVSYTHFRGQIPQGLVLDHLCRNTSCVNPWHLEAVTIGENVMRGDTISARNAKKMTCPSGHEYAGENLFFRRPGSRNRLCRECSRRHARTYKAKSRTATVSA